LGVVQGLEPSLGGWIEALSLLAPHDYAPLRPRVPSCGPRPAPAPWEEGGGQRVSGVLNPDRGPVEPAGAIGVVTPYTAQVGSRSGQGLGCEWGGKVGRGCIWGG
jgi:hypothetical protein